MSTQPTTEERLTRLEAVYEHLATKADIAELKADIAALEARLMRWGVGAIFGGIAVGTATASAIATAIG